GRHAVGSSGRNGRKARDRAEADIAGEQPRRDVRRSEDGEGNPADQEPTRRKSRSATIAVAAARANSQRRVVMEGYEWMIAREKKCNRSPIAPVIRLRPNFEPAALRSERNSQDTRTRSVGGSRHATAALVRASPTATA